MPRRLDARAPGFAADFSALLEGKRETAADVDEAVAAIIADVRTRGDAALIELTRKFDRLSLAAAALRISVTEIDAAEQACAADALEALDLAARRIESYHRRLLPSDLDYIDA